MTARVTSTAVVLLFAGISSSWILCAGLSQPETLDDGHNGTEAELDNFVDALPEDVPWGSATDGAREQTTTEAADDEVGERLLVTPYLDAGRRDEVRRLSRVKGAPFPDHVESYSGFFTVDAYSDSNLFFWFFPAENNYREAPIIVWLQGGPGQPSLIGIFMEIGPFTVSSGNISLQDNPYSWHKNCSLLFIDNPVGTGFSYTSNESSYATRQIHIADGLYTAVLQFFDLFEELQGNPLYVAGESYGGKHAISLAHAIHNGNPTENITINLKGLFILSGFFDPVSCLHYSDLLYQVGLVDFNERKKMKKMEQKGRQYIHDGMYEKALHQWNMILEYCQQASHIYQLYNFMTETYPALNERAAYFQLVQKPEVRKAIHVGPQDVVYVGKVYSSLGADIVRSVKPWLEEILDAGYRVVCINGQLDIIVAYPLAVRMYQSLIFAASKEYQRAKRQHWYVDNELGGYSKTAGNFTEVLVLGAGHMIPLDKPRWTLAIIHSIIREGNN